MSAENGSGPKELSDDFSFGEKEKPHASLPVDLEPQKRKKTKIVKRKSLPKGAQISDTPSTVPEQIEEQYNLKLDSKQKEKDSILKTEVDLLGARGVKRPRFSLGNDNFQSAVEQEEIIVDKTEFIAKILQNDQRLLLITRPRRFGKTFNLSMLQCFLDSSLGPEKTLTFFENREIGQNKKYQEVSDRYRGQYPVIFLTLKNITSGKFEDALQEFVVAFTDLYENLREKYSVSATYDLDFYTHDQIDLDKLSIFLKNLSTYIQENCGKQVFLLIDEYDAPLYRMHARPRLDGKLESQTDDYSKMVNFTKELLNKTLNQNKCLMKAVLTGVMHESNRELPASSGVYTVLDNDFDDCFGFTEKEILVQLEDAFGKDCAKEMLPRVMDRYAGYHIGSHNLAPPWALAQFVEDNRKKKNELKAGALVYYPDYWLNSASNELVKNFFRKLKDLTLSDWLTLVSKKTIFKKVSRNFSFVNIDSDPEKIWSFLLHYGYLTVCKVSVTKLEEKNSSIELMVPNQEILNFFSSLTSVFRIRNFNIKDGEVLDVFSGDIDNGTTIFPNLHSCAGSAIKSISINRHGTLITSGEGSVIVNVGRDSIRSSGLVRVTTPTSFPGRASSVAPFESEVASGLSSGSSSSSSALRLDVGSISLPPDKDSKEEARSPGNTGVEKNSDSASSTNVIPPAISASFFSPKKTDALIKREGEQNKEQTGTSFVASKCVIL